MKPKMLIIMDLSRTLLLAEKHSKQLFLDSRRELETLQHNDKQLDYKLFWRPGRELLLDTLMLKYKERYDVAVWSSLDRDKTSAFAKSFFGKHFRNLLFVSTCNREQYEGLQKEYSTEPIKIDRNLSLIKDKFPQYDLHNTVMVNVIPNNIYDYTYNDIIIPQYKPGIVNLSEDSTLEVLVKYLNGVSHLLRTQATQDVRTILRAKPFSNLEKRVDNLQGKQQEYI